MVNYWMSCWVKFFWGGDNLDTFSKWDREGLSDGKIKRIKIKI